MSEWWTYTLADFLLFSPRTWNRLFELHNLDWWPLHLVAIGCGASLLALLQRGTPRAGRLAVAALGCCWLWVAWAFQLQRYATINWAASWFAAAFALEGIALLGSAAFRHGPMWRPAASSSRWIGAGLVVGALVVLPLLAWLPGRAWTQAQVFGMTPDPTVVATLGVLIGARPPGTGILLAVPLAWCAISGATLWVLGAADAWMLPLAGAVTLAWVVKARPRAAD